MTAFASSSAMTLPRTGEAPLESTFVRRSLVALLVLVLALSFFFFSQQSLRLDEAQSIWQASHSLPGMLKVVGEDVHVPLYHTILHYWLAFFGTSVPVARLLSFSFFLLMIPAMYQFGKTVYGSREGLLGALLVSVSPFLNWYGNEIRMYSLFTLLAILSQWLFVKLFSEEEKGEVWVGYTIVTLLGIYTHYFFAFVVLAQILFFFSQQKLFPRRALAKFVIAGVVVALLFAPWVAWVVHLGSAATERPLIAAPTTVNLFNTFSQFFFGFQDDHVNSLILALWPLAVLLAFLSLQRGLVLSARTQYLLYAALVPVLAAFATSFVFQPIYLTRYLILAVPPLYLLVIQITGSYPKLFSWIVRGAIVSFMVIGLAVEVVSAAVPVKENYADATAFVEAHATPQDIFIASAPFTIYPIEYYYHGSATLDTLPIWDQGKTGGIPAFDPRTLPTEVKQLAGNHEVAWLMLSYDQGYEEKIRTYFDSHFTRLYRAEFSPGLTLSAYRLRYDIPVKRVGLPVATTTQKSP